MDLEEDMFSVKEAEVGVFAEVKDLDISGTTIKKTGAVKGKFICFCK